MKIGIICLANGPYSIFIDTLIKSCEEKFLINHKKEYFIITDSQFEHNQDENVNVIYKERQGWPGDCLIRPQYSFELKEKTEHLDFIYFFNANMFIYSEVGEEILPDEYNLVGVEHPHYTHRNNMLFTYDRNPDTNAYIPLGEGNIYYQACLWGGTRQAFMKLSETIKQWVDEDLDKTVEPIWLDESYLNRYFLNNPPKTMHHSYAWPTYMEIFTDTPPIKIIQLQKKDYLPDNFRYKQ
jgi:hypothetical protein